jgi:hypothetical protein
MGEPKTCLEREYVRRIPEVLTDGGLQDTLRIMKVFQTFEFRLEQM